MIGELQTRQILALIKDGCTPEQVAESMNVDPALIKLIVARNSQDGDRDITDEDLRTLRRHAFDLATSAEDESIQAKMTQWLIERDKPKSKEVTINPILAINQAILASRQSFNELLKEYSDSPPIDVSSTPSGNEPAGAIVE